jgi:hypothetical protein
MRWPFAKKCSAKIEMKFFTVLALCVLCSGCNFIGRLACKLAGTTDMGAPAPQVQTGTNHFSELPGPPR